MRGMKGRAEARYPVIRFGAVLLIAWFCICVGLVVGAASDAPERIDNVILMILDGAGPYQYELTRLVYGDLRVDSMYAVGLMTTHSADAEITKSPAAATALATGHKTNNDMVALSPDGGRLKTVLEYAQDRGMGTGLITTVMIYDATPAAFAAHSETRYNQAEIASEMMDHEVDVLLGGGWTLFYDEDLLPRAEQLGYTYVEDEQQLLSVTGGRVLGLFAPVDMSYELDRHRSREPSIAQMTAKAIEILSAGSGSGFFLMVEGGKVDWAGHRNDAASIAADLKAFDDAVGVALEFAGSNENTLIVVTSDHECGGLSFVDSDRLHIASFLEEVTASAVFMGTQFDKDRTNVAEIIAQYTPIEQLTRGEIRRIQDSGSGWMAGGLQPGNTIASVVSQYARANFSTTDHTAADVPLFWYGAGAFDYSGTCDNTDVGQELIAIVTRNDVWSDGVVDWNAAADWAGTYASVIGSVERATPYEGTTYLNLGSPYPERPRFDVIISPEYEEEFVERFGQAPAEFFDQKDVVVYGEIQLDTEGGAYIDLHDPHAIRVIEDQDRD